MPRTTSAFPASRTGAIAAPRALLIDLDGVQFTRRLTDRQRIEALAQLNASLADGLAGSEARRRTFGRYAQAMPFRCGTPEARRRIARRSVQRASAWSGEGCTP